jgi:hypothetical protein
MILVRSGRKHPHDHKVRIYKECHSVSPRRNWDSPTPSPAKESVLSPGTKGGGPHSPGAGWGGSPNSDNLCAYSVGYTVLIGSLESIFGPLKSLKIRALSTDIAIDSVVPATAS